MLQEKLPPQDIDSEASCLAAALLSKDALFKVLEILQPEDFYLEQHNLIFSAIRELDRTNRPIDLITIKQKLIDSGMLEKVGGDAFLAELYQTVATSANAEFYASRVKDLSLRRKLIDVATSIVEKSYDLTKETPDLMDETERDIFDVTEGRIAQDFTDIATVVRDTLAQVEHNYDHKGAITGIPTGFKDIDEMLTGLHASELLILAARPGMGKTALALNFLNHMTLVSKKPVFFFSLEMPATQLLMRLLCIEAMVDSQRVRTGHISVEEIKKIHAAAEQYMNAPIYIDDTPGATVFDIRAKARRVAQRAPLGCIIVDYLQLLSSKSKVDRQQQISEISRGLKLLSRELQCPVLALSQLSRAVESRTEPKPQLSDLRESGAIEQDADVVMFIYREEKYKPETEKKGIAEVIISKQRSGPTGSVELMFWDTYTKFGNLDKIHSYDEAIEEHE